MKINESLSSKIILIIILCILIIMIITGIILYITESNKQEKILRENSNLILRRLVNSLREPLWNFDYTQENVVINLEMENNDILAIQVFDENKQFMIGKYKNEKWEILDIDRNNLLTEDLTKKSYFILNKEILKDDKQIGYVTVYFTDWFLKLSLRVVIFRIFIQTIVLSTVLIIVMFFSIDKILITPIIQLNRVVQHFSEKDFSIRSTINLKDEIGSLSNNFNNMANTIQEYSQHLEDLVAKRTEQLNKAIKQLNKTNKELLDINNQMKKELQMAQKIQEAMIPKIFPNVNSLKLQGLYIPMADLGGDYYDVFKISESKLGFVIADVCGHGVPAALITTMAKVSFNSNATIDKKPSDVVKIVNNDLFKIIGGLEYLTAFFGIIDMTTGILEYTNAGHPDIYLLSQDGKVKALPGNSPIIGYIQDVEYNTSTINITSKSKIILYTDGVIEAKNSKGELFDKKRLIESIILNKDLPANDFIIKFKEIINNFTENVPADDDITMLVIDIMTDFDHLKIDYDIYKQRVF